MESHGIAHGIPYELHFLGKFISPPVLLDAHCSALLACTTPINRKQKLAEIQRSKIFLWDKKYLHQKKHFVVSAPNFLKDMFSESASHFESNSKTKNLNKHKLTSLWQKRQKVFFCKKIRKNIFWYNQTCWFRIWCQKRRSPRIECVVQFLK